LAIQSDFGAKRRCANGPASATSIIWSALGSRCASKITRPRRAPRGLIVARRTVAWHPARGRRGPPHGKRRAQSHNPTATLGGALRFRLGWHADLPMFRLRPKDLRRMPGLSTGRNASCATKMRGFSLLGRARGQVLRDFFGAVVYERKVGIEAGDKRQGGGDL
jgi:hypothetical protein